MENRGRRSIVAPLALSIVVALSLAACSSSNPSAAAQGATWLSSQLTAQGYIAGKSGPSYGDTAQTVVALAAAGSTASATKAANYLAAHVNDYVDGAGMSPSPTNDSASALAELILAAYATKTQSKFHAASLVARLEATQQADGLFGTSDPTYDGVYRESSSLQALKLAGKTASDPVVAKAITWLEGQQCSNGGFSSDAANVPCSGSAANYQGPDTNSTAQALVALAAQDRPTGNGSVIAMGLQYLASNELNDGGWGYFGAAKDASSTGLVIDALIAQNKSPALTSGQWAKNGTSPMAALDALQVKSGSSVGGFLFQAGAKKPEVLATEQAIPAVAGAKLPIG